MLSIEEKVLLTHWNKNNFPYYAEEHNHNILISKIQFPIDSLDDYIHNTKNCYKEPVALIYNIDTLTKIINFY